MERLQSLLSENFLHELDYCVQKCNKGWAFKIPSDGVFLNKRWSPPMINSMGLQKLSKYLSAKVVSMLYTRTDQLTKLKYFINVESIVSMS